MNMPPPKPVTHRDPSAVTRTFAIVEMRAAIADVLDAPSLLALAQVNRAWASTALDPRHWQRFVGAEPKIKPTEALAQHAAWRSRRMAQQREPAPGVMLTALGLAALAGISASRHYVRQCAASSCEDKPVCEWLGRQRYCEETSTAPMWAALTATALGTGAALHVLYRAMGRVVAKRGQAKLAIDRVSCVHASHYAQHPARLRLAQRLHHAVSHTRGLHAAKDLLALGAPANILDAEGRSALRRALCAYQFAAATELVEHGAHVTQEDLILVCEGPPPYRQSILAALPAALRTELVDALPFGKLAAWVDANKVSRLEDIIIYVSHDVGRLWLTQPPHEGVATLYERSSTLARKGDARMQRLFDRVLADLSTAES